jgi:DnaJ domain
MKNASEARQTASFYDVLQVSPSASQEVIHAAYRALARGYHPDVNPTPLAAQRMLELNTAHDVLGDSERRARYDLRLVRSHRSVSAFAASAPTVGIRGRPRPQSPTRIEEQRAVGILAMSAWPTARFRIVVVVVLIVVFMLLATAVVWLTSFLDELPDAVVVDHTAMAHERPIGSVLALDTRSRGARARSTVS